MSVGIGKRQLVVARQLAAQQRGPTAKSLWHPQWLAIWLARFDVATKK